MSDEKPKLTSRQAQYHASKILQGLAQALDEVLEEECGRKMGFCLVVFSEADLGYASYAANTPREPTLEALQELVDRLKAELPDVPLHKRH